MEKPTKVVAKWVPFVAKIFNDICVEEILAHNRPQHCLYGVGYANLVRKFYERTKRPYNEGQMKNRWDILKKKYTQWKTLNLRSTGLGRDPSTGCIVADNDWWEEQNAAMPGCICFRDAPLEHEDQMWIMFEAVIVTNETSYVRTRGANNVQNLSNDVEGDVNGEIGAPPHIPDSTDGNLKRPAPLSPNGKKKKTFRDKCMKRLVDAYEMKAQSSKHSATSQVVDHVRDEIGSMLDQVINDGAEEGSDEHFYATQLLQKKENRNMFITLKTPNGRLNWLKRAWEARKKH